MDTEQDYIEKIEAYLLGRLNQADQNDFEMAMRSYPNLLKEVEEQRAMQEGIRIAARRELTATLNKIHDQKERTLTKTIPFWKKKWVSWGAAAAIVLLATNWFLFGTPSNQALADQYYQPYNLSIVTRDNSNQEKLLQLDALYADENYQSAAPLIESLLAENPEENTLRLALAICQYENNQPTAALQTLQTINQDALLQDQVNWYSALIQLDNDQVAEAKSLLELLAENKEVDHHAEAVELLKKLP